jgi:N,N-dimethylformamidase
VRRIVGYTDRSSARPGETIRCHVSLLGDEAGEDGYRARLAKVVGVDEAGTVEKLEAVHTALDGVQYAARRERTATGSYGVAQLELVDLDEHAGVVVQVAVMPTLVPGSVQGVLTACESTADGTSSVGLALDESMHPLLLVELDGRTEHRLAGPEPLEVGVWYLLAGGITPADSSGFITVGRLDGGPATATNESLPLPETPRFRRPTVLLAARAAGAGGRVTPIDMFTGRLEQPLVATAALPADVLAQPRQHDELLGAWDLGERLDSFTVPDLTGRGSDLELHGLPKRGATGSNWDSVTTSIRDAPDQYRAAHFFADAVEDAAWPVSFSLTLGEDLRSGVYAFVLKTASDTDVVPFTVLPTASKRAKLLVLLPTATYMAYSNARFTWEKVNWEVQCEKTVQLGRSEQILLDHPELGASSYDQYLDGSNVTFVSWLRPNLDMRAAQARFENYPCDLHLLDWLDREGFEYDVATDADLDREGVELLRRYQVVVTGTHPEYASTNCCDALAAYTAETGRLMVLGGNAFHYLVAFSVERPWLVEVRKPWNAPPGSRAAAEGHLALTGEFGADADGPRPSERFLRTSTASMGFDLPRPYERLPDSDDPRAAFIFEGIDSRTIGAGGLLGGAVFQEWDNTDGVVHESMANGRPLVLARSSAHTVNTRWFGATKRRNHGELVFFVTGAGGAVFSAASMGWCLCLRAPDVSRVTGNVLRRFLDPAPLQATDQRAASI